MNYNSRLMRQQSFLVSYHWFGGERTADNREDRDSGVKTFLYTFGVTSILYSDQSFLFTVRVARNLWFGRPLLLLFLLSLLLYWRSCSSPSRSLLSVSHLPSSATGNVLRQSNSLQSSHHCLASTQREILSFPPTRVYIFSLSLQHLTCLYLAKAFNISRVDTFS